MGLLIVLYPYITGLVAGAFILASLERVFKVEAVKPTYRLALLTALASCGGAAAAATHLAIRNVPWRCTSRPHSSSPWRCSDSSTCGTSWWSCYWRSGWSSRRHRPPSQTTTG